MSASKQIKESQRAAQRHQELVAELQELVQDIARCEKTIAALQAELNENSQKYAGPRTTKQDVEFLTVLLDCAKRKLAWEKQIASLQKRTPELLERMTSFLNDPVNPPSNETRAQILESLQAVQATMERLQSIGIVANS
jgi:chromosome segregation ATPase